MSAPPSDDSGSDFNPAPVSPDTSVESSAQKQSKVTGFVLKIDDERMTVRRSELETVAVGRASSNLGAEHVWPRWTRFHCPVISRAHAEITFESGELFVTDVGSHHGTWLKSESRDAVKLPPHTATLLHDGDEITLGKVVDKGGKTHNPVVASVTLLYDQAASAPGSPASSPGRYGLSHADIYGDDECDMEFSDVEEVDRNGNKVASKPPPAVSVSSSPEPTRSPQRFSVSPSPEPRPFSEINWGGFPISLPSPSSLLLGFEPKHTDPEPSQPAIDLHATEAPPLNQLPYPLPMLSTPVLSPPVSPDHPRPLAIRADVFKSQPPNPTQFEQMARMQALQSQYIGLYSKLDNFIKSQASFPQEVAERVNNTLAAAQPREVIIQRPNVEELVRVLSKVTDLSDTVERGNMNMGELVEAARYLCLEAKKLAAIEETIGNAVESIMSVREEVLDLKRKNEAMSVNAELESDVPARPSKRKAIIDVDAEAEADTCTRMDTDVVASSDVDLDGPPPKKRTKTAKRGLDGTSMIMGALAGSLIAFAGVIFSA